MDHIRGRPTMAVAALGNPALATMGWTTQEKFARSPEPFRRFVVAIKEAVTYAYAHPDEAIHATALHTGGSVDSVRSFAFASVITMAAHGARKLFGWFGGPSLRGLAAGFDSRGLRPGLLNAVLAGLAEFGGGLLLTPGFLTPAAGAAIIAVMVVAIATSHWPKGFFNSGVDSNIISSAWPRRWRWCPRVRGQRLSIMYWGCG